MKPLAAILLVLAATGIVSWLGVEGTSVLSERRKARSLRAALPSVELVDVDGAPAHVANTSDRSTVLVFFTTTCEYCRDEIAQLKRHATAFAGMDVVLISPEDRAMVRAFQREHRFDLYPQFRVLRDTVPTLGALFRIRLVPTMLVYNPEGQLTGEFEGVTSVDLILQAAWVDR